MERFDIIQNKYYLKFSDGYPCNVGLGVCGAVQLAINILTKEEVVVKKVYKNINSTEVQIWKKLDHPNVVKYLDSYTTQDLSIIFIVLEYVPNGSLFQLIKKQGVKNKQKIDRIMKGICEGVEYLHSLGIIHRDIKPQNILLDHYSNPKITDFGSAIQATKSSYVCGTYQYMAPQLLLRIEYTNKIDIWCLGIILFQMIQGKPPYHGISFDQILSSMSHPIYFSENFRQSDRNIIKSILRVNPNNRPQIQQITSYFTSKNLMKNSATTMNLSSDITKKSNLMTQRQGSQCRKNKPLITITGVKILDSKNSLSKCCNAKQDRFQQFYSQSIISHKPTFLSPTQSRSKQLNKTWSKVSLKRSRANLVNQSKLL